MNDLPVPSTLPALLVAAGALAALSLAEGMRPLRPRREPRWRHAARNVAIFGMAQAIGAPLRLLVVAPLAALVAREGWGLLQATPLPLAVTAFGGVALLDFSLWGWHVMNHRIGVLWRFHAPHHADLDLDATSALRFHAGELALSVDPHAGRCAGEQRRARAGGVADGIDASLGLALVGGRLPLHLPAASVVLLALDPTGNGRNVSASVPRPPAAHPAR